MPRFEVHIPAADQSSLNVSLRVVAPHWMAALKAGLHKLGEQGSAVHDILVDIQDDNSVHITEAQTGRVFQIRQLAGEEAVPPEPKSASVPRPAPEPQSAPNTDPPPKPLAPVPDGAARSPELPGESPRRTTSWPWLASLSAQGEVEAAKTRILPAQPPERVPSPKVPRALEPSPVVELKRRAPQASVPIGRASADEPADGKIEDVLWDVFERVQEVNAQPSQEAALYFLLDLAMEKIATEAGSVLMADAGTGDLSFAAVRGPKAKELIASRVIIPFGVGIVGFCAAEGVSLALSDVQKDPRYFSEISERLKYETKSALCSPMMTHGRAFGCMQLLNKKDSDVFTKHEIGLLAYIAHQAALYLNNIR